MAVEIKKILWDFGDGTTSNEIYPAHTYLPGKYTVTCTIWDTDGDETELTKDVFVSVASGAGMASGNFIDYPMIYHYGWKDEHGYGWSLNEGNFPIPYTDASVCEYEEDGITYTLVWDYVTGKEYQISTRNNHVQKAVYKDKTEMDGTGGYSIPTEIITPEFTPEMKRYDLTHLETNMTFRPDIMQTAFTANQKVAVSLITDDLQTSVETQEAVDTDREIEFYYENRQTGSTGTRQLKIDTAESNYQLLDYESFFKTSDRFKRAGTGKVNEAMLFMSNPIMWLTRGKGYSFDRVDAVTVDTVTISGTVTGPDGKSGSGATYAVGSHLGNVACSGLMLWCKSALLPAGSTLYKTVGDWNLYYCNGVIGSDLYLSGDVFDVRLFTNEIPLDYIASYAENIELYLPRY